MRKRTILILVTAQIILAGVILVIIWQRNQNRQLVEDEVVFTPEEPRIMFGLTVDSFYVEEGTMAPNQTLSVLLNSCGLSIKTVNEAVGATEKVFNVRNFRSGNRYLSFYNNDTSKKLKHFVYQIDKINYLRYDFTDSVIVFRAQRIVDYDTVVSSGVIKSSLWQAIKDADTDPMLALMMSDIYAWTIDFYGLQKGDSFKVVYITQSLDSTIVGIQKILASRFTSAGAEQYAFYFEQDTVGDYFDQNGQSLRRAFLKAPLKFSRISSGFTNSRYHPVLKIRRPHHGVDYAAPSGTPVMTIGDGKVVSMSWDGGYGRRVVIKHNSVYKTGYAHLSAYAKGLKAGDHVKQGQVIGYVGSSGLSTGPHLDFRFYENEKPVNPLTVKSPPALPVDKEKMPAFNMQIEDWMEMLK